MELTLKDVDERIHDKTEGPLARIESAVDIIAVKVGYIEEHMKEANHATAKNVEKIESVANRTTELEKITPHSVINCPQNETLKELKDFVDNLKGRKEGANYLKDKLDKDKADKRADFLKTVTTIGIAISAVALVINLIFSVIGFEQRKGLKSDVKEVQQTLTPSVK